MQHATYLLVDLGCLIVPFLSSFHPRLAFYKAWTSTAKAILVMMLCFIPVDVLFTQLGVWGFDSNYTLGYSLFHLPLEEWLFFICIPYASLFTYYCLHQLLPTISWLPKFRVVWILFFLINLVVGIYHYDHLYTSVYHLSCAFLVGLHLFIWKSHYIHRFFLMYLLILIPFVISNGILTGLTFWRYPLLHSAVADIQPRIVWYNNEENLGWRLFSIPLDDIAYGCTMLLLSVTCFEYFERKRLIKLVSE
jgi:lycopene cyclase domain-containing protein